MLEQFDHYITKNIKSFYKHRIISPIIYLCLIAILFIVYPVGSMLLPKTIDTKDDLGNLYADKERYVRAQLNDLYFTGYTKSWLDHTVGYYYYTMMDDDCVIVLMSPDDCQQGIPTINHITIRARILKNSAAMNKLLTNLAEDLSWTERGISSTVSIYMLSQPDATNLVTIFFLFVVLFTSFFALCSTVIYLLYIFFPVLSRPVQRLGAYGKPSKILSLAEEELATLPQLATEDMFITEHFFIETSNYGVAIVPISEIRWIYKYSTLHKFLWHHFSISYTLYITAAKRQYIRFPKNVKSDIDGIMDYLSEANHDILVGFSEENRLKIEAIQGDSVALKKFLAFLSKRV